MVIQKQQILSFYKKLNYFLEKSKAKTYFLEKSKAKI